MWTSATGVVPGATGGVPGRRRCRCRQVLRDPRDADDGQVGLLQVVAALVDGVDAGEPAGRRRAGGPGGMHHGGRRRGRVRRRDRSLGVPRVADGGQESFLELVALVDGIDAGEPAVHDGDRGRSWLDRRGARQTGAAGRRQVLGRPGVADVGQVRLLQVKAARVDGVDAGEPAGRRRAGRAGGMHHGGRRHVGRRGAVLLRQVLGGPRAADGRQVRLLQVTASRVDRVDAGVAAVHHRHRLRARHHRRGAGQAAAGPRQVLGGPVVAHVGQVGLLQVPVGRVHRVHAGEPARPAPVAPAEWTTACPAALGASCCRWCRRRRQSCPCSRPGRCSAEG